MDWDRAIERNREALKRILATLVAMAGLGGTAAFTSPLWGGRREASGGGEDLAMTPTRQSYDCRPPHKGEVNPGRPTLPRHLHRAVLRLLRPAESAARRLVIVAARDVVADLPPLRPRKPTPKPTILRDGVGTGIVMPRNLPHPEVQGGAGPRRTHALPLFDPMRRPPRLRPSATGIPRISIPGLSEPAPARRPLSPHDRIDAGRLLLRLAALSRALDDLPREARRFARWRCSRNAEATQTENLAAGAQDNAPRDRGRMRRVWPLRGGRPPGQRPARCRRPADEVHEVLADLHGLAFWALERPASRPDT